MERKGWYSACSRTSEMKPAVILFIVGGLYVYAALMTKSLLEGPHRMKICEYKFAHRTCDFLSQLGD